MALEVVVPGMVRGFLGAVALSIARATAESIETVARAIIMPGGEASVRLQLAERFLKHLRSLANQKTSVLLPADLTNLDKLLDAI